MLSSNGTFYQSYHFVPPGDATDFGLGDNQIGAEWLGHSAEQLQPFQRGGAGRCDGMPGLPTARATMRRVNLSQAFDAGKLGLQRVGVYRLHRPAPNRLRNHRRRADRPAREPRTGRFPGSARSGTSSSGISSCCRCSCMARTTRISPVERRTPTGTAGSSRLHYYISPQFDPDPADEIVRMSAPGRSGESRRPWATSTPSPSATGGIRSCSAGPAWPWSASCLSPDDRDDAAERHGCGHRPLVARHAGEDHSLLLAFDFDF